MKNKTKYLSISLISALTIYPTIYIINNENINNINSELVSNEAININKVRATDQTIVDNIIVQNHDILKNKNTSEISALLKTSFMTQEILDKLSITIPLGADPLKVSFDRLETDMLFKVSFTIYYNGIPKSGTKDYLNATPNDQDIVNEIVIKNPNKLIDKNSEFIIKLLNTTPMSLSVLNELSISFPEGIEIVKIVFTDIKVDIYKISFNIQYNGAKKIVPDFLNLKPTNQEIVNSLTITNNDALVDMTNIQIDDLLNSVMTKSILDRLSIKINPAIVPSKITFDIIDINLFKVTFIINYNNVAKENEPDFFNINPKDVDVANEIKILDNNKLINKDLNYIENLLNLNPMTKEVLNELSIFVPEGADISKVSFSNIIKTNPIKIIFVIKYNNVEKLTNDFLNVSFTNLQVANSIIVKDENILLDKNVLEIRKLLRTTNMTQNILNQLSILIPDGAQASKVSFESINIDNLFKITFVIKYNKVAKEAESSLNATPTNKDIANKIIVKNQDVLKDMTGAEVQELLNSLITENLLNDLTIIIPMGVDFSKISFTNINNIKDPFRVFFTINYDGVPKEVEDYFTVTIPSDQSIVNSIIIENNDSLLEFTGNEIVSMLQKPMTSDSLNKLGVKIPQGAVAGLVKFSNFETNDLFKVTFVIQYNKVAKENIRDFLNCTPKNEDIANKITIVNNDSVNDKNIIEVNSMLVTKPMTQEILTMLSVSIPLGADPSKVSFSNIVSSNPLKIFFTINYNNAPKLNVDWLLTYATDGDIANNIVVKDANALSSFTVDEIRNILEINPMTQEILTMLSISIPEGANASSVSFLNINISDSKKIVFTINYNGAPKFEENFLNSKSYQDIVNEIVVDNTKNISKTANEVELMLETNPITKEILIELLISIPNNIKANDISFSNIKIISLFEITFVINYKNVPKTTVDSIKVTPNNIDVVNQIKAPNNLDNLKAKTTEFIKSLLETDPMTQEVLDKLSITIPKGSDPSKISFTNIDIKDSSKIFFTVNYAGVAGATYYLNATPLPSSNNALIISLSVIGGIAVIAIIGLAIFLLKNNMDKKQNNNKDNEDLPLSNYKEIRNHNMDEKIKISPQAIVKKETNYNEYINSNLVNDKNFNKPKAKKILQPIINNPINLDDNKWADNKWYNDKSETGEWSNGNWLSNDEIDKMLNDKAKNFNFKSSSKPANNIDDWDNIFNIKEK